MIAGGQVAQLSYRLSGRINVNLAVTVVILAVANFQCTRVHQTIAVVAVGFAVCTAAAIVTITISVRAALHWALRSRAGRGVPLTISAQLNSREAAGFSCTGLA